MRTGQLLIMRAACALALFFTASPTQAADVRLFVLAPQPPTSLKSVESQGANKPAYAHSYDIPYASAEQQIRNKIKKANIDVGDTVVCSGACPDVHWHVSVTTDFSFTQTNQPKVTAFGDAQENGVDVTLQTQFKLHTVISARVWAKPITGEVEGKVDVPIDLVIGLRVNSKLGLWPDIKSIASYCDATKLQETACVTLTLDDKNIDLSDPHGVAVGIGAALGALIGASPLAAGIGDPLSGMLIGALVSNEAANIAEQKVQAKANEALNAVLQIASIRATWLAGTYVDAKATQINAVKSKLLDTKLPGINKSLQQLADAFGLSLDVQTTTPGADVNVIVTPRFTAAPSDHKLTGKLRMPKEACVYMEGPIGYIPMGLVKVNEDLVGKKGTSCSALLSAGEMKMSGYLGADPIGAKAGGHALPTWNAVGTPAFTGTLSEYTHGVAQKQQQGDQQSGFHPREPTGYFECPFEIAGVPNADIIQIALSGKVQERVTGFFDKASRFVEVVGAGPQIVLDHKWSVIGGDVLIGGEGQCTSGKVVSPKYQARTWLQRMRDLFDPDKCANCDIQLNEGMLEIKNSKPVLENPAIRQIFSALQRGEALPETSKGRIAPTAPRTGPGAQQAPAAPQQRLLPQGRVMQRGPGTQEAPATQQGPATQQTPGTLQRAPAFRQQLQGPGQQKGTVETPR